MNALDVVANGFEKGVGPFKLELTRLLGSMTSVYQLCPTFPCVDTGAGELVHAHTLDNPPAGIVRDHLVAAREEFHGAIQKSVEDNEPDRYSIQPVVGIFQPTFSSASLTAGALSAVTATGEDGGDGTVPRVSATPIELADKLVGSFVTDKHGSLQNVDSVLTQVAGILTFKPSLWARDLYSGFELDLPDVVSPGEEVRFEASTRGASDKVTVEAIDADTDLVVSRADIVGHGGRFTGALAPLPEGVYRFVVRDATLANLDPISDLFVVADDSTAVEGPVGWA
jgi:hypothetical protein